jgi:hypothetical protein
VADIYASTTASAANAIKPKADDMGTLLHQAFDIFGSIRGASFNGIHTPADAAAQTAQYEANLNATQAVIDTKVRAAQADLQTISADLYSLRDAVLRLHDPPALMAS